MTLLIVSSILLWLVVCFNLLITMALVRQFNSLTHSPSLNASIGLRPGERAPDFAAQTLQHQTVTLTHYIGRPTLFLFISPTCPACIEGLSQYEAAHALARQAGANLSLVMNATVDDAQSFVTKHNLNMPLIAAPVHENPFLKQYKATAFPSLCYLDANGKVLRSGLLAENLPALMNSWRERPGGAQEVIVTPTLA